MKVDIAELKKEIKQSPYNNEQFAKMIGIDCSTFYRKMKNNATTFDVAEIYAISDVLNLSPSRAAEIFFAE